ncbi:MAG TPA: flippase [Candidatus Limnocylindria bacterium]|nr:flippase [Candidatus Limnocylindria bacterium]
MDPQADISTSSHEHPKSDDAKRLVRGSSLLLIGRLVSKLGNFGAQVLIVRYLSQSTYGAFAYGLLVVAMIQSVITLGLDRAVVRFLAMFYEQKDYRRLFGTISMTVLVILSLGLAAVLILFGFQDLIARWVPDRQTLTLLLVLIFLAPVQALDEVLVGMFAVFSKPRAIFWRKHVLAPALKLAVVIGLILTHSSVFFLAVGYLLASLVGVAIYGYQLFRVMRDRGLLENWSIKELVMPWREVFSFSTPLLTSELVGVAINTMNVVLLGHFWTTTSVAELRAVQPTAKLNELVMASFATLFTPLASRLFANGDKAGINHLYWRTTIWIAIISFPVFAVTFALAQPITVLLYGQRYESSAPILAMLSLGYYFNAALGFNGLTLKVIGRVRYLVFINLATVVVSLGASLLLVPRMGAMGAGIAMMISLIVFNVLKQAGLRQGTGVSLFEWQYFQIYLVIGLTALGLMAVQLATSAPVYVSLALAVVATLIVFRWSGSKLDLHEMFPEAMRIPGMGFLVSGRRKVA